MENDDDFDDSIPVGAKFAEYAQAIGLAKGNLDKAEMIAHQRFSHHSVLKIFNDMQLEKADGDVLISPAAKFGE